MANGSGIIKDYGNQIMLTVIATILTGMGVMIDARFDTLERQFQVMQSSLDAANATIVTHLTDPTIHRSELNRLEGRIDAIDERTRRP